VSSEALLFARSHLFFDVLYYLLENEYGSHSRLYHKLRYFGRYPPCGVTVPGTRISWPVKKSAVNDTTFQRRFPATRQRIPSDVERAVAQL
jgi:hypothetical protein